MTRPRLSVAIVGCGLIGEKRARAALAAGDSIVACVDIDGDAAKRLAAACGSEPVDSLRAALDLEPEIVVVATSHDRLAALAAEAMEGGSHVLVEKPAGLGSREVEQLANVAADTARRVKVGFNHRFHPALVRLAREVHSRAHGELMSIRARYGHGGRPGYDREWRAQPERSGGGELIDQGMHVLDLVHWLAGPLPLHSALLRTQFWETTVEDNAALILGDPDDRAAPWAMLHVSWTEWKNTFSIEVYCTRAKLQVDGLTGSYGTQELRIFRMRPELGPPDLEEVLFGEADVSWAEEWSHFADVVTGDAELVGTLDDALYAWRRVEEAYARSPFAATRAAVLA